MIKLKLLLEQQAPIAWIEQNLTQILDLFHETPAGVLGSGYYGVAVATQSGKVVKFTADSSEAKKAMQLKRRGHRKHLIQVFDVRRIDNIPGSYSNDLYYAIHINRITPLQTPGKSATGLGNAWNDLNRMYFSDLYSDHEVHEQVFTKMNFPERFKLSWKEEQQLQAIVQQRPEVEKDARAANIRTIEAHAGNVGFNALGNFVLYDLQAKGWDEPNEPKITRAIDAAAVATKYTTDGIDTPNDPTM